MELETANPSASAERLLTADQFYSDYGGRDFELVRGKAVPMTPTGATHGRIDNKIARRVGQYVEDHRLGAVFSNTGFILARGPDLIRAPDQAFVGAERINQQPPPEHGFWEIPPDLAIEIVSPKDSAEEIGSKVADYLSYGVRLVWVVYPRLRQLHLFRHGRDPRILAGTDTVDGEEVLPGFSLSLDDLWR